MFVHPTLVTILVLPTLICAGGQIPVIDNVIGGVPVGPHSASEVNTLKEIVTPGKLRVVENSGVCGRCIGLPVPLSY